MTFLIKIYEKPNKSCIITVILKNVYKYIYKHIKVEILIDWLTEWFITNAQAEVRMIAGDLKFAVYVCIII